MRNACDHGIAKSAKSRLVWIPAAALIAMNALAFTPQQLLHQDNIHGVALSPDGKRVAIGIGAKTGVTDSIAIIEIDRLGQADAERRIPVATAAAERIVTRLYWANNSYLIAHMTYGLKDPANDPDKGHHPSIHSVDANSGSIVPLDRPFSLARLESEPRPDENFIFISTGFMARHLYRVDLKSGDGLLIAEGDPVTTHWRVKDGRAVLKFNKGRQGEISNIYEHSDDAGEWTYVNTLRFPEDQWYQLRVVGRGVVPTDDFLRMTRPGADTDGIHRRDLRTKSIVATVAELPQHDITSVFIRRGEFVAAGYVDDRDLQVFADPVLQQHYDGLVKYFGPDVSVRLLSLSDSRDRLLLYVTGPQIPGEYHVYDVASRHTELVATERPWLGATGLAPVEARDIRMRDGATIRAYLTCPAKDSEGPRPLVVMPPAGPLTMAWKGFNAFAQAFAAEGWCVVEPNYRGTYGRGRTFNQAGDGQWSGRVAEDILGAVDALVAAGIADREQIAGFGEGLGGHALLAGAASRPELYRAIVAFAVVADPKAQLESVDRKYGKQSTDFGQWQQWLGDMVRPKKDRLLDRVAAIDCPMLLMHTSGYADVPIEQSKALQAALERSGHRPEVRWPAIRPYVPEPDRTIAELESVLAFLRAQLRSKPAQSG